MKTDTKNQLLQVTRELMDEDGLDAVTLRSVGSKANLSRCAVYRHFADKEALLVEITTENFKQLLSEFENIGLEIMDFREVLKQQLIRLHNFGISHKDYYQLMFATNWDQNKYSDLHKYAHSVFEHSNKTVKKLLEYKGVNTNSSTEKTAIIYAFIHGLTELHMVGHFESSQSLDQTEQLIDNMLDMITNLL